MENEKSRAWWSRADMILSEVSETCTGLLRGSIGRRDDSIKLNNKLRGGVFKIPDNSKFLYYRKWGFCIFLILIALLIYPAFL